MGILAGLRKFVGDLRDSGLDSRSGGWQGSFGALAFRQGGLYVLDASQGGNK